MFLCFVMIYDIFLLLTLLEPMNTTVLFELFTSVLFPTNNIIRYWNDNWKENHRVTFPSTYRNNGMRRKLQQPLTPNSVIILLIALLMTVLSRFFWFLNQNHAKIGPIVNADMWQLQDMQLAAYHWTNVWQLYNTMGDQNIANKSRLLTLSAKSKP